MDSSQFHGALNTEENCKYISAEDLQIIWGDNPLYWEMVPDQGSIMFPKNIARLKRVCWFDVKGEIVCSLPPGAFTVSWRAYLSLADLSGWDSQPVTFTFAKNETEVISECKCYINRTRSGFSYLPTQMEQFSLPTIRAVENGWTEYDVGEFVVAEGEDNCALKFAMLATDNVWKSGLSLDGVFIRPKSLITVISAQVKSDSEVSSAAGPSNSTIATSTTEHSRRKMTNGGIDRSSLVSESRVQIRASQAVREKMDAHPDWKVPIRLIDVKISLASYHGDTLEIHTQSFPRDQDNYCIISYVWSHEDNFVVDEIRDESCGLTRRRRTITSCSLASFVAMLDICDQMGMKYVWIDCVCVEQENDKVKSLQLAEMGRYYSCATRCLVFLNGLNMYAPPIFANGDVGSWYDRVWTVQEAGYTFGRKTFVHALPNVSLLESSDIITRLIFRAEHVDLISRFRTYHLNLPCPHSYNNASYIPPVSEWFVGLVCEENYGDFWSLVPKLVDEVRYLKCDWMLGISSQGRSQMALELNPNNPSRIIRETMRGTRGCKYEQDRIYSIMTLLGIELDVSYSRPLWDTILKAAESMSAEMLVSFVTATWYSQDGHALPGLTGSERLGFYNDGSLVAMGISHCITDVKVEGSDLLITTKTKSVNILRLGDSFYSSQHVGIGAYPTQGHAYLLNWDPETKAHDVKARGETRYTVMHSDPPASGDSLMVAKLLFMGKSTMMDFEIGEGKYPVQFAHNIGVVPANVCLVVHYVNGVWIKVGVLYVSEDLIFESESEQLALKL